MQASHWHEALHVWVPPIPHACVAPGMQAPSFMHGPQADHAPFVQVRDCVPQFPQAWVMGPLQVWPVQVPHWQVAPQVRVPPVPQDCMAAGAHAPWFMHGPQSDQTPLLQVRVWLPQLPQAWPLGPEQLCPVHSPHWQKEVQPAPHACVEPGWQPMAVQVPTAPATVQLWQLPPQGRSQQTPPEQASPLWQSLLSRHDCPFAACPHLPPRHRLGAWHIGEAPSPTQALLQFAPSAAQV
jgi:hypothetical protein